LSFQKLGISKIRNFGDKRRLELLLTNIQNEDDWNRLPPK